MNKLVKIAMLASAILIPQVASASHAPPVGTLTGTDVYVEKGINFTCDLTLTTTPDGSAAYVSLTPGSLFCLLLSFNGEPYPVVYDTNHLPNGRHLVTLTGVDVTTITSGDCAGNISAEWDGSVLYINTTLPAKSGGNDCIVIGTAS